MKKLNLLLLMLCCAVFSSQAQTRYLDQVFDQVSVAPGVTYATNISILTGTPAPLDLKMNVYTPVGDDETNRPVVLYFHTGSFLPQYFNGQITGGLLDSTVVEMCTRLAKMGYVAIAATYRQGWLPTATDQNVRTSTLLQAAYRGIQDSRACVRFLRKSVAEAGNPYGIDPEKIVMWGQGTGGYISLGAAYLDSYSEVVIDKFINTETLLPFIDTTIHGNVYGTNQALINIPNHVGYSSDFKMAVNMGGALGDISWIDGNDNEPATIGYHVVTDPFAPFGDGPVIVPTTGDFVVAVSGTRTAVAKANELGNNDVLADVLDLPSPLTAYVNVLKPVPFQFPGQAPTTLGEDHIYPLIPPNFRLESGPWDWWSKPYLDAVIAGVNATFGTTFNSDTLHHDGLLTNPNMSPQKARAYIDTIMTYYAPRACAALRLGDCCEALGFDCATSVEELLAAGDVGLFVAPNPAGEEVFFQSRPESPMLDLQLFDFSGRLVQTHNNVKDHVFLLQRGSLPPGMYVAKVRFKEGVSSQKLIFR